MAQNRLSLDIKSQKIPLSLNNFSEISLIRGLDSSAPESAILYAENVMPTPWGYSAISREDYLDFTQTGDKFLGDWYSGTNVFLIFSSSGSVGYLVTNRNYLYSYDPVLNQWTLLRTLSSGSTPVSVFYLKGSSYFFHKTCGLYKFTTLSEPEQVTLNGLQEFNPAADGNVESMTSCLSYIIGITKDAVYWSDPIDETEFDPEANDTSLAGSTQVLSVAGKMKFILSTADSFIIYTDNNAILGSYSNNADNPFIFREIPNSAGVFAPELTTYQANIPLHFAITNSGLMQLSSSGASILFPELGDFLTGDTKTSWNPDSNELVSESGVIFSFKLQYLNSRLLCISYGKESNKLDTIVIYDTILQRWGVIKIDHYSVCSVLPPPVTGAITYQQELATGETYSEALAENKRYMDYLGTYSASEYSNGSLVIFGLDKKFHRVQWGSNSLQGDGLLLIGKLNLTRRRLIDLQSVEVHGRSDNSSLSVEVKGVLKAGHESNYSQYPWNPYRVAYQGRTLASNLVLKLEGPFTVEALVLGINNVGFV